ncbi:hypothetical protein GCM10025767_10200 [Thalassotalea piscium]
MAYFYKALVKNHKYPELGIMDVRLTHIKVILCNILEYFFLSTKCKFTTNAISFV